MVEDPEWKSIYSVYYDLSKHELNIPIGEKVEDLNAFPADKQLEEVVKCAEASTISATDT
jgi:hypothetical protein